MKPSYRPHTPRATFVVLAVVATAVIGLSIEGLAHYTAGHAAQANLPAPKLLASVRP